MKKNKKPKSAFNPPNLKQAKLGGDPKPSKKPVLGGDPSSCLKQKPAWQFSNRDLSHPQWGWNSLSAEDFISALNQHLCKLETMTWDEILKASGGRGQGNGNNHHNIEVSEICRAAQQRLLELNIDVDQLFSLRLTGAWRLWGIKEGQILRFLWSDKNHEVCPPKR